MYAQVAIFGLLFKYSYLILFPLVVIEGPVVTIIAGFLVSTGFMNLLPTYLTVVAGDLTGDVLFYLVGRFFLNTSIYKILKFFGLDSKRIMTAEEVIKKHRGKILFFGKLSHAIGAPILIAAGAIKISIRDFLWYNFWATLPKSLIFILVGYFFGHALDRLNKYLGWTSLGLAAIVALIILGYLFVFRKAKKIVGDI